MINSKTQIYLASKSPRRRKLLKQLNLKFKSFGIDIDETVKRNENPSNAVVRLSREKLEIAKRKKLNGIIITADTIVVLGKKILGKPKNEKDAFDILKLLSGRTHIVYTGFSVYNSINQKTISEYEKTEVTFRKLSDQEILEYIASGSPMDKAGAYGIQDDFGAVFIKKINGCYYNVVGLPLAKLYHALLRIL
ncbi:MAG: septum formation protein Maf [Ignavibacteriales bacterium UTCHB2]|jgi:septum formation protein|nr:MAG: Septum formation protein Maf [Ignavibacteria bacterium ADurb.Bin266]OQY73166.1 MAG: septum formation protein Maf [Ignavibacteriales bacterium UTCHB2]HQI41501.1 Maf family protein [Ignavibacteriaceae bacterium]HQJ46280.1 Maf family protein [Ignavibacteriaceae bacterium]